jgi:CheY-like chemotaxis protein
MNPMRALIVDRDVEFLEILETFFRNRGHEVAFATSGVECLEVLRDFNPDVILVSYGLQWGGVDGILAVLREDPLLQNIPVVEVLGPFQQAECSETRGSWAYLQRPFRLADMLSTMNGVILEAERRHAAAAAAEAAVRRAVPVVVPQAADSWSSLRDNAEALSAVAASV